jgi:hypothetical protein
MLSAKDIDSDLSEIEEDNDLESEEEDVPYCDPPTGFVRLRPSKVN